MDNCPLIRSSSSSSGRSGREIPKGLSNSDNINYSDNNILRNSRRLKKSESRMEPGGSYHPPPGQQLNSSKELIVDNMNGSGGSNRNRISIFKALTRRGHNKNSSGGSKHKRLDEDWLNGNEDSLLQGVTFSVKFLGSALTDKARSSDASEATRTVIQMVKAGKKTCRVAMTVSPSGVVLVEEASGEVLSEISIYDIAHCSMDPTYPSVFSFIATNKNETNECYCFACDKRKMAQKATLTIAEAFNVAYEIWRSRHDSALKENQSEETVVRTRRSPAQGKCENWVNFDDETNENLVVMTTTTTTPGRSSGSGIEKEEENLLICLN